MTTRERDLRSVRRRQGIRVFFLTTLLVVTGLVAAANTSEVPVDWLLGEDTVTIAMVIAAAWASGLLCGLLLARPARVHRGEAEPQPVSGGPRTPPPPPVPEPRTDERTGSRSGSTTSREGRGASTDGAALDLTETAPEHEGNREGSTHV